jgi:hypothetical protein
VKRKPRYLEFLVLMMSMTLFSHSTLDGILDMEEAERLSGAAAKREIIRNRSTPGGYYYGVLSAMGGGWRARSSLMSQVPGRKLLHLGSVGCFETPRKGLSYE